MKFSDVFVYTVIFVVATFGTQAEEPEPFRLHGQILNSAGDPIGGAIVNIGTPPTFFERERTDLCRAGADGRFTLESVYPPPFKISVSHDEYLPISEEISRAEGNSPTPIVLTRGETLVGLVDYAVTAGTSTWVTAYCEALGFEALCQGDASGAFRFAGLPPGKYLVSVRLEDKHKKRRYRAEKNVFVVPDADNRVKIALSDGQASISGVVQDSIGTPLAADIIYYGTKNNGDVYIESSCSSTGLFHIDSALQGPGELFVSTRGKGSRQIEVDIDGDTAVADPITLERGSSVRYTFVNVPTGVRQVETILFFGKQAQPTSLLSDIQNLLDQPVARAQVLRDRSVTLEDITPGTYTLLAYPLNTTIPEDEAFRKADTLLKSSVYMDSFTVAATGKNTTVAVTFPSNTPYQEVNEPTHPVVGKWIYTYKGSQFMRTFTRDGRCILSEAGVIHWTVPYVILGKQRVMIVHEKSTGIHTVQENDTLDIHGRFTAKRLSR